MRLIRCHIENFGRISDREFTFDREYDVRCESNGWGKTTLATFIKVMFYGFDNEAKRSELENERKHYRPWQGGVYGGELEFECAGKAYRITRTFGAKEKDDTFELRDVSTNLVCSDFSSNVGEDIFQIDSESFKRTIYIGENDRLTEATGSISAKMGDLAEHTDDINGYESVKDKLKSLLNSLTPSRSTGEVSKLKSEIAGLEVEVKKEMTVVSSIDDVKNKLSEEQSKYDELKAKHTLLNEEKTKILNNKDVLHLKSDYDKLFAEYEVRNEEYKKCREVFAADIPEVADIDRVADANNKLENIRETMESNALASDEKAELEHLSKTFEAAGVPETSEIENCRSNIGKYSEINSRLKENAISASDMASYEELEKVFKNGAPDEYDVESIASAWNERTARKNLLSNKQVTLSALKATAESKKSQSTLFIIIAIIIIIAGAGAYFVVGNIAAVAPIVGVALLLFAVINRVNIKNSAIYKDIEDAVSEIAEDEEYIKGVEKNAYEMLGRFGHVANENTVLMSLINLQNQIHEYNILKKRVDTTEAHEEAEELKGKKSDIENFLHRYFDSSLVDDSNYLSKTYDLENMVKNIDALTNRRDRYEKALGDSSVLEKEIAEFFDKLAIRKPSDIKAGLSEIRVNLEKLKNAEKELNLSLNKKKEFEEANDVTKLGDIVLTEDEKSAEDIDLLLSDISEEMEAKHSNILSYNTALNDYLEQLDDIAVTKEELEEKRELYQVKKKQYDLLKITSEKLEEAKVSFTAKYMGPLKSSFDKYFSMLISEGADTYSIDANMNLTVKEQGLQRDIKALSAGYKDLTSICMRMALVDAMYQGEKPFIIMDDPYINLDADKMEGGLKLLKDISHEYQVIYLTCHESRM